MLASIIAAAVVFIVVRFFASRYVAPAPFINRGAVVLVVAICAIVLVRATFFGERPALATAPPPMWPAAQSGAGVVPPAISAPAATAGSAAPAAGAAAEPAPATLHATGDALASIDTLSANGDVAASTPGNNFGAGSTLYATGWAASRTKKPFAKLTFVIDRHIMIDGTAKYRMSRPDVAKAYAAPAMDNTGFQGVPISTVHLAKGTHSLQAGGFVSGEAHPEISPAVTSFTLQ